MCIIFNDVENILFKYYRAVNYCLIVNRRMIIVNRLCWINKKWGNNKLYVYSDKQRIEEFDIYTVLPLYKNLGKRNTNATSRSFVNMNIILVCQPVRIHTDALMHKPFTGLRKRRKSVSRTKANLYIILRRLYRMADLAEAAPGIEDFNYSCPSVM